jgi:hypothetical protein
MMKTFVATILTLLLISPVAAQRKVGNPSVKSIRQVAKSKNVKKPRIRIEVFNPAGPRIGGLSWCLTIGKLPGILEGDSSTLGSVGGSTLIFVLTLEDWKKVKNGDALWLSWGCRQPSEYAEIKPFAYLNKKMLGKK